MHVNGFASDLSLFSRDLDFTVIIIFYETNREKPGRTTSYVNPFHLIQSQELSSKAINVQTR